MQRDGKLHLQTEEGESANRAEPTEPTLRLAEGTARGAAVCLAVSLAVPLHHKLVALAVAVPAASCAIIAFTVVAYLLDAGELRAVLAWVRRRVAKLRSQGG